MLVRGALSASHSRFVDSCCSNFCEPIYLLAQRGLSMSPWHFLGIRHNNMALTISLNFDSGPAKHENKHYSGPAKH